MEPVKPCMEPPGSVFVEIAKEQEQYRTLPAYIIREGPHVGEVVTEWEFTDEEREAIANGANLMLVVHTFGHPLQPLNPQVVVR